MALLASVSATPLAFSASYRTHPPRPTHRRLFPPSLASLSSSSSPVSPDPPRSKPETTETSPSPSSSKPLVESYKVPDKGLNYALASPNGKSPVVRFAQSAESSVEKVIFDFRFLALFAVGGSLAGSLLCFLNGCVYIVDAYKVYWTNCVKGIHTGKMVLRLVEAIDVYLAGTVMLIFGMGLYGLFISNVPPDEPPSVDRALKGSSLFGMFALKERPQWMKISSLDELKTKVGHVIVMILLVKMFERSKMVAISTGMDLLSYSVCIFLSSASLYILHNLHKGE
ncbi:uncharacterized protein LOC127802790 [Diospyros lotus]|uniref:uncharacterized protein LOC127802790 n=1 Tax=Diospyros lotus TaxID=55363 RepID=UPI00224EACBB|nr:uncharacterized protein LOC127802790 [Diospyros lotus]